MTSDVSQTSSLAWQKEDSRSLQSYFYPDNLVFELIFFYFRQILHFSIKTRLLNRNHFTPHPNIFPRGGSLGQKTPENSKHFTVPSNLLQFRWFNTKAWKYPLVCSMTPPGPWSVSWPLICGCSQQYFPRTWDHSNTVPQYVVVSFSFQCNFYCFSITLLFFFCFSITIFCFRFIVLV